MASATRQLCLLCQKYRKRLRTTNMLERFIQEIRRREKVIRIFPNTDSAYRLVGALCAETHEEWSTGRRYLNMDEYFRWRADRAVEDSSGEEASFTGKQAAQPTTVPAQIEDLAERRLHKIRELTDLFFTLLSCAASTLTSAIFSFLTWMSRMNPSSSLAKIWFVLSLAALSFGYGFASHAWELFPKTYVEQAWRQARAIASSPDQNANAPDSYDKFYNREGVRTPLPDRTQSGLTSVTSSWKDSTGFKIGVKLIDQKGSVLHEWLFDRGEFFPEDLEVKGDPQKAWISSSYVLPGGDLAVILGYVGMARVDACGNVRWALSEGIHHWGDRAENGTFWVPGTSAERRNSSERYPDGYPGIDKPVWLDRILKVSGDGEVLGDIYVLDVMYENGLERYIPKTMASTHPKRGEVPDDITHMNDIEPLDSSIADEYPLFDAGDLLVSLRHPNLVFVFDPETLDVKWHASDPFVYQHDPDFIEDGWIGIFNNNRDLTEDGSMLRGSEIVVMQPHTDSVRVPFPTELSEPFYTFHRGTWQKLENGNMLLAETSKGRVVEVTPNGRTAWEWVHESYGSKVSAAADVSRLDLTREEVASWSCSSVDSGGTAQK